VEASDSRCTHLVVEDSVTELPSGLVDQSHCQVVKQEVCLCVLNSRTATAVEKKNHQDCEKVLNLRWLLCC